MPSCSSSVVSACLLVFFYESRTLSLVPSAYFFSGLLPGASLLLAQPLVLVLVFLLLSFLSLFSVFSDMLIYDICLVGLAFLRRPQSV